jgi:hypothetical protein
MRAFREAGVHGDAEVAEVSHGVRLRPLEAPPPHGDGSRPGRATERRSAVPP